jgi:D-sedoheptulose 7-phosphate isomerase
MKYTAHYKARLLDAIQSIDLDKVDEVIQIFKDARSHSGRIFVCGDGEIDLIASEFLCDLVKEANLNQTARFRILPLSSRARWAAGHRGEMAAGRLFVEQLKNFAQPGDVFMGISATGGSLNVVRAIEYAKWIGCRTIAVTGDGPSKLSSLADIHLQVAVPHTGSVEDAELIICHMIGYYFLDLEGGLN